MTPQRFWERVAIVTGGAGGIGWATARCFASEGARVVIADIDGDRAALVAAELKAAGALGAWGIACDVSNPTEVEHIVVGTIDRFSHLDFIVNNAGLMVFKPLEEQTDIDWLKVLEVNLMGTVFFTQQAFRRMRPGGCVVNMSSVHAERTTSLVSSYAAAKAAVLSFTRSASIEGRGKGIRVNAVVPGAIDTPMLRTNPNLESGEEQLSEFDIGKPDDVAAAVIFLCSKDASFITGAELRVDGGRLARL